MAFWKKVKQTAVVDRLVEEKLYEQVLKEVESGVRRDGLWAKAFQRSQGNEQKATALYFKYRVQSIKDEEEIATMHAELLDKSPENIVEPSKDDYQGKGCSNCGCRNFEYDKHFDEYICIDCGFSTKEKQFIADSDISCADKMDAAKTVKEYSDQKYRQLHNDFSEELSKLQNRFLYNLKKINKK